MTTMTSHQMSTTTCKDEFAVRCTCRPSVLFVGSEQDCARNMAYHDRQAKVEQLAEMVLTQTRERLRTAYPSSPQWEWEKVQVKPGPKYTKIDRGPEANMSGMLMIENATGEIFGIKGYGKVHKGHHYGNLDTAADWYWGEYYPRKAGKR